MQPPRRGRTGGVHADGQPAAPTVADASEITRKLLGRPADSVSRHIPPHGGGASFSYRVSSAGREMLLKVNKGPREPVGAYYYGRLREAGVPVPALVAFSSGAPPAGQACALFEWVEGVPAEFGCADRPPYDEAQLGEILRTIHDLRYQDGFGRLDDEGHAAGATWREALRATWSVGQCVKRGAIPAELGAHLEGLPRRFDAELSAVEAGLLHHEDIMFNGNVIVGAHRRIVAVVDFGGAMAGDPLWELMWFDYYFGEYGYDERTPQSFDLRRFRRAYGRGYDPHGSLQRLYLVSALLEKLSFLPPDDPRAVHHRQALAELAGDPEG